MENTEGKETSSHSQINKLAGLIGSDKLVYTATFKGSDILHVLFRGPLPFRGVVNLPAAVRSYTYNCTY